MTMRDVAMMLVGGSSGVLLCIMLARRIADIVVMRRIDRIIEQIGVKKMNEQLGRTRAWVVKYGTHIDGCRFELRGSSNCTCGLLQVLHDVTP